VLAITVLLAVAALILALRMRGRPVQSPPAEEADKSSPAPVDIGRQMARALKAARPKPAVPSHTGTGDILKDYPPNSRPVTQSRAEAFKYNRRDLEFLGVPTADKKGPPAFYSAFTADKFNVFEGETITLTLRAAKGPNLAAGAFPITDLNGAIA
jgi:hypothetical protein